MAPSVAVIIRTKNEEEFIRETLEAVCAQTKKPDEIIVVDSGSCDNTLQIASHFETIVVQIEPEEFTYGRALNIGFERASSDLLVSLSADAQPADENWLAKLTGALKDARTAGVYGRQIAGPRTNLSEKRDLQIRYGTERKVQSEDYFFSNVNSAIKKEVWNRIRFSESIAGAEDWDWARRVQEEGHVVVYEPDAAVFHSDDDAFMAAYRRMKRVTCGVASLDPSLRVSLEQVLVETAIQTVLDMRFIARSGMNLRSMFYSPFYRLARSMGRYRGVHYGKRASHTD
ncbi:glycosyltransferase [candidate division TA06 bacterium]|uniref:Glycosyltransferase n=1 Tax=candidate division TA06 bacterium TaxID=2250710 RepID=A0A523XUZ2_UNCT6|nr:MAG: glycosyltransferase [candidate division TA06 bacterium]